MKKLSPRRRYLISQIWDIICMTRRDIYAHVRYAGFEICLLTFAFNRAQVTIRLSQPKANTRALGICEKCGMKGEGVEAEEEGEDVSE